MLVGCERAEQGAAWIIRRNDATAPVAAGLAYCLSMTFSENRYPLFRIMLYLSGTPVCSASA